MSDLLTEFEDCAGDIIENEMGLKAILIDPDGKEYGKSALDETQDLKAMLTRESLVYDTNSGAEVMAEKPVASFRVRSLERVPKDGENWVVRIQESVFSEDMKSFTLSGPPEFYRTIGHVNLNLQAISQI
jgi:hypothetical protein